MRVEVRHTAGRCLLQEVFTVGRAAECDVQTTGDPTTSRLQLLVISLPGGPEALRSSIKTRKI